jgi:hypothetical protein
MKPVQYIRKRKMVTNVQTGVVEQFKSVNGAKRHSRALQMKEDGSLGRGSVRRHT